MLYPMKVNFSKTINLHLNKHRKIRILINFNSRNRIITAINNNKIIRINIAIA